MKAVSTYFAERREADRFQPEGWETAEGRALLSRYRAEMNSKTPAADLSGEDTGPIPTNSMPLTSRGVARVSNGATTGVADPSWNAVTQRSGAPVVHKPSKEVVRNPSKEIARRRSTVVARHSSDEMAADRDHRPRHDGSQSRVDSSYLLTHPPTTRHGASSLTETARVLRITNIVRGPDGDPIAGTIVTISLIADHGVPGLQPDSTIDGAARIVTAEECTWSVARSAEEGEPAA